MKLSLLLIVSVAGDLIGYNRGVNNALQHARGKLNAPSTDNRLQLIEYLLLSGRFQEARNLVDRMRTYEFQRYERN